jgi:putative nucleotidyltransferase with HDIG domain
MIKKIPIAELKVGMYLHDVNCSWRVRPIFVLRFKIVQDAQIEEIRAMGVREVYIDTTLGDDLPGAPSDEDVRRLMEDEAVRLAQRGETPVHQRLASQDELRDALVVHDSASHLIRDMMNDVRLGGQIELSDISEALQNISNTMLGNFGTIIQLGQLKTKDDYTFQHSVSVCALMTGFGKVLELKRQTVADIGIGALLHDIGKMRVPPEVLNKPGRLTDAEFDEIKQHVAYGREILRDAPWVSKTAFNVMDHHHERYDGTGYPGALKAGEISNVGQMAAIVDVYDAITSERVYHTPMLPVEALRKLQEWGRFHFNEELVAHFVRSLGIYPIRTLVRLESGLLGIVVEQNPANLARPVLLVVRDENRDSVTTPYRLDLDRTPADRILRYEDPARYGIDVGRHLMAA